jgi:putative membrane protein
MFALAFAMAGVLSIASLGQTTSQEQTSGATATSKTTEKVTASDRVFMRKAAEGGQAEVELGRLASEKASSPEVKQFGQRMVDDHSKANDRLKQIASEKGVKLPEKLSAKDEATKRRLEKLSGKSFDRAYIRDMVADHSQDAAEFRTEANKAKDPALKNFASDTLTTIRQHLKEAKSLEGTRKTTSSPSGTH